MAQPSPLAGGGLTEPVPLSILAQLIPPMLYVEETEADGDGDVDYLDDRRPKKSKLGVCKKAWTPAEDWMLQEIVEKNGAHRWSTVATYLPGRMGKQCRERWFNHLCPDVKKGAWTPEEDRMIMESVEQSGTRWSHIVKLMPGRTDNAIKNRYNSAIRRAKRLQRLHEAHNSGAASTEFQPMSCSPKPPFSERVAAEERRKRKREAQDNDGTCAIDDVGREASDADTALVETGPSGGLVKPALSDAVDVDTFVKMADDKPKANEVKSVKKQRSSKPYQLCAQQGSDFDENLLGPEGLLLLSPQHVSQLASILATGEHPGKQEELLELIMSQHLSPNCAIGSSTVESGVSPKWPGECGGQLTKADGSPFDFNAALRELSPHAFRAASSPPALAIAPPSELIAATRKDAAGGGKRGGASRARGSAQRKKGEKTDPADGQALGDEAAPKRRRGAAKVTSARGVHSSDKCTSAGAPADRPTPEDKSPMGDTLFSMLESLDPDEAEVNVSRGHLYTERKQNSPPDSLKLVPTQTLNTAAAAASTCPRGAPPKDDDWLATYNAYMPPNSSSSNGSKSSPANYANQHMSSITTPYFTNLLNTF